MQELSNKTIREIALEAPLTTRVFAEFKIDYCCGGRIPFEEACMKAGVDSSVLRERLESIMTAPKKDDGGYDERKTPTALIDHVVSKHHVFTRSEIARLLPLIEKVDTRHGDNHPELHKIKGLFLE